mmetsp:Transcript_5404/g.16129  ORF Transcript_5404/g.16129 Transcript_5404/m.16129 type:complete len:273 (+) Transcript_5404:45-863(+)
MEEHTVYVRYFYPGQRRQDGTIAKLECGATQHIRTDSLLNTLTRDGVDLERFTALYYDYKKEGFVRLSSAEPTVPLPPFERKMVDVKLERKDSTDFEAMGPASLSVGTPPRSLCGGWFAIGILRGKSEPNHGTLWRTALSFGAAFVFSIGQRYRAGTDETSNDTFKVHRHVPMLRYDDMAHFSSSCPYNAPWVAVELGGSSLTSFEHPTCAIYILGAEDHGLPKAVVSSSAHHVSLPSARPDLASFNVATAGAIVMYDRWAKFTSISSKYSS